jgi:SAM-dependent methyltransferase
MESPAMEPDTALPQNHWQEIYKRKNSREVSWFRPHLEVSLELLLKAGLNSSSRVIDVGGGASTLVDDLLQIGVGDISILDLSAEALEIARQRLGARGGNVKWIVGDLLSTVFTAGQFDLWHDRAVFHFLTSELEVERYAHQVLQAVTSGSHAVIGGFAPDGPERCSGLPVARRSAEDISRLLGPNFELIEERADLHLTPGGSTQSFAYALLRRR